MALDKSTLETAILNVFTSMTDGSIDKFSDGITNAIVSFVSNGEVSTVDMGTITAGAFVGTGSGEISVTSTDCTKVLKNACKKMNGETSEDETYDDDYLAEQFGFALKAMSDNATVDTDVQGTVTTTTGATSTLEGSASGSIACVSTSLVTSLKTLFSTMYEKREETGYNGDSEFASTLADAIYSFWTSGVISTNGSETLAGSIGVGALS